MGVDFGLLNAKKKQDVSNRIVSNRAISVYMRSKNKHHGREIASKYYMRQK